MAAGQAEHLYRHDPKHRRVAICDLHNRPRWHAIWQGNPILATPGDVARGEQVQRLRNGPETRPYIVYPFTPESGWTFNQAFHARDYIAKLYLTVEEVQLGISIRDQYGPYVLIEPWSKHQNLRWPLEYWRELVESRPDLTFIQHVHRSSPILPGITAAVEATFRQACGLLAVADVYVRGESGMLHAAAALQTPSVAIWGGCMDWEVLGNYPFEEGVGVTPPFCGCYKPCAHCTAIMAGISVEAVSAAIDRQIGRVTSVGLA